MRDLKKLLLFLCILLTPSFVFGEVAIVNNNGIYMEDKVHELEDILYKNQDGELSKDRYIRVMILRANYYMKGNKNLSQAADDLRSALYFLSKSPTSEKYKEAKEKLDRVFELMGYKPSQEESLELAKNLYLQRRYFASAYEFQGLLNANYESHIVSEYLGDISQKLNNPKQAVYYYKKSIKYYSKNEDVYYKLALIELENGQGDNALENFKQVIALSENKDYFNKIINIYKKKIATEPNNSNYYEILALAYQKLNDFKNAYDSFSRALQLSPNDTFIKYHFAKFLQQSGVYSEAVVIYNKILSENPYDSQIRVERAKCFVGLGQKNEALKDLQGALILYPNFVQAQYEIYKLLKPEDLDDMASKMYPLESGMILNSEVYSNIGEYALEIDDTDTAIKFLKYSILKDEKNSKAYIALYKTYELLGNREKSYETIKGAYEFLASDPEINKLYSDLNKDAISTQSALAISYIRNNDYTKAVQIYEQINPKGVTTYISIANCYKVLKQPQKAIDVLKEAQEKFSDNSDIYYHLAVLFSEQNSPQSAREYLKKSIELDKNNLKAYKYMAYLDKIEADKILDSCYDSFKDKDYKTTLKVLSDGISKVPTASELYYYRGMVYEECSEFENAIKDYKMTIKLNPDYIMGYYKLGKSLDVMGKEREAMEAYEKFLSEEPPMELVREIQPRLDYLMKKYY